MKIYRVSIGDDGGPRREVKVPSKTGVQAVDAAAALVGPGEAILGVVETDDHQDVDAPPAGTQTHPDQIT
ncbi:hypothetical protein [Brevundimonas sp.]|uniref:hypothetical protein n=1 Tax=Brevundimonas sp. TaxID=1871086 RepID=UPI00198932FF|nr:hypothetical protein [Brevundimonas sp.]MBD3837003.1 hypothetical protein [Brevundimonas sp.]